MKLGVANVFAGVVLTVVFGAIGFFVVAIGLMMIISFVVAIELMLIIGGAVA